VTLPRTEGRDARLADLDQPPTVEVVRALNDADASVVCALRSAEDAIAALVDAVGSLRGRVVYAGAGSAGQMAVADAAEWGPTFSVPDGGVVALLAGAALPPGVEREAAEDDAAAGAAEVGALEAALRAGALTGAVVCAPGAPLAELAEHPVVLDVGPEVIAGSTRLKAATAQKLCLNAFSTALMVRRGRTYGNLMSGMRVANAKLRERAVRICCDGAGCDEEAARGALAAAGDAIEVALVMLLAGVDADAARRRLAAAGSVREAAR